MLYKSWFACQIKLNASPWQLVVGKGHVKDNVVVTKTKYEITIIFCGSTQLSFADILRIFSTQD